MLHPSDQAVSYIWERFSETFFDKATFDFLEKWRPIKEALGHKPFNPDGEEYKLFMQRTHEKMMKLKEEYPELEIWFYPRFRTKYNFFLKIIVWKFGG